MSDVITFSRHFPVYHPKKGQETLFVEKIWNSFYGDTKDTKIFFALEERLYHLNKHLPYEIFQRFRDTILTTRYQNIEPFLPKHHTCRAGHGWKPGDMFSPRVWSGKPYYSKQIIIGEDIEIKKVYDFRLTTGDFKIDGNTYWGETELDHELLEIIAKNDGLSSSDFKDWFFLSPDFKKKKVFDGQIICWNDKIEY